MPPAIIKIHIDLFDDPADADLARRCIQRIMDALTENAADYIRSHPETPPILDSNLLRYTHEGGFESYDVPSLFRRRGHVCTTLAPVRAGELRARGDAYRGLPPMNARVVFFWRLTPDGRLQFHTQVERPDGRVEDPSKKLGM